MSKSAIDNISTRSDSDQARLAPIAGPLIDSEGFKRLHLTTFLGGLSPKFAHLVDAPVSFTDIADGSRGDHSIGVAALIDDICFVAAGSVGRYEALPASDLDLIPVCMSDEVLDRYRPHDGFVRKSLGDKLGRKVSAGSNLTKAVSLDSLLNPDTIGGSKDNSRALTRRILVLTEGKRAGGQLPLRDIRAKLLDAYAGSERTRGKHVLSLCNDIGRHYRTLCIEYKAKVDVDEKDWCTRNLKLRHSRKLWYFSSMMSIVALASTHPDGRESYKSGLLRAFALSPTLRLVNSVAGEHSRLVGKILDHFACFLNAMSEDSRRKALSQIDHGARYENDLNNPFPAMKRNSDALHAAMSKLIQEQEARIRQRILDWFLL